MYCTRYLHNVDGSIGSIGSMGSRITSRYQRRWDMIHSMLRLNPKKYQEWSMNLGLGCGRLSILYLQPSLLKALVDSARFCRVEVPMSYGLSGARILGLT